MITGYLDWTDIPESDKRIAPLWWQERGMSYTRSGYGSRIPTARMVRLNNRWRRVYVCIWSNSGTAYIPAKDGSWTVVRD